MFSNHQLESILAQWPVGRLPIRAIRPVSGGLSGALIWKVDVAAESTLALGTQLQDVGWALKAWPAETSPSRLGEIHDLVQQAAAKCDLLSEPAMATDGGSIVRFQDRLWDCSPWVPGHPLPDDATPESLENAGEAIAKVHEAFSFSPGTKVTGVPRSIEHRLGRFAELSLALQPILRHPPTLDALTSQLTKQFPSTAAECHALAGVLKAAVDCLRESWSPASEPVRRELAGFAQNCGKIPIHRVLRDVHRGHVFVEPVREAVMGIIDYDAVGLDTPSTDIARFAGSFQCGASDTLWGSMAGLQATMAGYRRVRSFSEWEYELAKILMIANSIGGVANWVVWLIGEQKCFPCPASLIRDRISHLIASNCRIC